ncbi:hypothetical protein KIM372_15420 [Bombiscardovia nodaiensis]|uniref:Glycerophosphodiester phosphodiesterase n=1 Tax=Bombiscardovia nodaiensis TaxID=2932181 RepID=A0ABM8B9Q9_9BIFI|nr:hypothetical protein KIM372_15420 [Bombiscardovia nodaiensis]
MAYDTSKHILIHSIPSPASAGEAQDAQEQVAAVAQQLGLSRETLEAAKAFAYRLSVHKAWKLPFLGYANEDGYGYAHVPTHAVAADGWDAHQAFQRLPQDTQTALAVHMLFTNRDVDRDEACTYLLYERGVEVRFAERAV